MNRYVPQRALTVGDGFRIGIGIVFWFVVLQVLILCGLFFLGVFAAVLGAGG